MRGSRSRREEGEKNGLEPRICEKVAYAEEEADRRAAAASGTAHDLEPQLVRESHQLVGKQPPDATRELAAEGESLFFSVAHGGNADTGEKCGWKQHQRP